MYAIMDLWPQDAKREFVEWTTVAVHDTEASAKAAAKEEQIVVIYDEDRWWSAEKEWRKRHSEADQVLLAF